jgi:FMN phosphatase YigB (HAD superfamily)
VRTPTVLFDLGNVLVRLDMPRGLAHFRRLAPQRVPDTLEQAAVFFSEASLGCNRGTVSPEDFVKTLARQLGDPKLSFSRLVDAWCDIFIPWPEMESLVEEVLTAGHRAYLASNTDPIHWAYLASCIGVLQRMDGIFLSFETGLLKPDPTFFRALLERFGLAAADCVYLDDRADNVEAARSLGIRGCVHTDAVATRAFLRDNGVAVAG